MGQRERRDEKVQSGDAITRGDLKQFGPDQELLIANRDLDAIVERFGNLWMWPE